jgi:predicted phage terminase large subunit-like protein
MLPRGTFKSSVVTVGGSCWLIANDPSIRILLGNGTRDMAVSFLGQIKNHLMKNEEYRDIYGDMAANADTWREDRFSVSEERSYESKDPTILATGISANTVGSHFNIAILDDPVTRENSGTKDQIDKTIQFYKDVLDLIDPRPDGHKPMIIIGTSWTDDDLYAWIQDKETGIADEFAILKLPAYEGEWGSGELLFPPRLTWPVLKSLKLNQGTSHFSAQYMLDPVPPENATFKKFKYYDPTDIQGLQFNKFIALDPAVSESKTADYSAMVCVGVDYNNDWYLLDVWRDRVSPGLLIDKMFEWDSKWKPITFAIEKTAFQKVLQFFIYDEMKKKNHTIYFTELLHNDRSKEDRIRGLEPRYTNGGILHCKTVPFIHDLEDELKRFPKAKHDDISDALASILEVAFPTKHKSMRDEWATPVKKGRSVYPA